jgi:hypothetical protein
MAFSDLRQDEERGSITDKKRAGASTPRPSALPSKGLALRVGPYLAVDLLDEGLTILVPLLELADLLELLGGETV